VQKVALLNCTAHEDAISENMSDERCEIAPHLVRALLECALGASSTLARVADSCNNQKWALGVLGAFAVQ
jgi:hypothetical protein